MATEVIPKWTFGEPTLYSARNSDAVWSRGSAVSVYQKAPSGWVANLYGGVQTNDDWASIIIPVNELKVTDLRSANWTYYMTNAESAGVNMVIWVHDRTALEKRAEITQTMGYVNKAAGWNVESLDLSATEMFYYGENTGTSTTTVTAGTRYTWAQFQADNIFSTWTIYRISFDYGWLASSTLEDVWVADIEINDKHIVLKPDSSGTGRVGNRFFTAAVEMAATSATLAPKTPFKLLSVKLHLSAAATQETFVITCDSGRDTAYDTKLYSKALAGVQDVLVPFGEGYEFMDTDEIDSTWTNTDTKTYGLTYSYQTVFEGD